MPTGHELPLPAQKKFQPAGSLTLIIFQIIRGCLAPVIAWVALGAPVRADTVIGDWGHFILNKPRVFLNNPDGRAFTVTVHVMQWPMPSWNPPTFKVRLTGPDHAVITNSDQKLERAECVTRVPAGAPGVYQLETEGQPHWISTTLDEAVLWTGDPKKDHVFRERFAPVFQCFVPRTWWFYVPATVTHFSVTAQRSSEYM